MKQILSFNLLFIAFISVCTSCVDTDCALFEGVEFPLPVTEVSSPSTYKHISINASLEQHGSGSNTRTELGEGNVVKWSSGDKFDLLPVTSSSSSVKDVLVVTVSNTSAGIGLPVSSSSSHYVKYEDIKVVVDGNDVTSSILSSNANKSNNYYLGIYNSNSKYQFAPAGTSISAQKNESYDVIPLVQSSSSSDFSSSKQAVVTLTGIQYSSDNQNWIDVNENTTLNNGSAWGKTDVDYEWQYREGSSGGSGTAQKTTATISSDNTFEANVEEDVQYYAAYPANSATLSGSSISFDLPQVQHYKSGSFAEGANPSAGVLTKNGSEYSVAMKNICGVLSLKLKGSCKVMSIDVTDPVTSHNLWGTASINVDDLGTAGATVANGSNTLSLVCDDGVQLNSEASTVFYLVVPVGSFSNGLEIKINSEFGEATKSTSAANTISRSIIKAMPSLSTDKMTFVVPEFNIQNDAVAEYLANSTANLTGSSGNYSSSFFDQSRSYRPDQPNTKTIYFSNESGTAQVVMSENSDFSSPELNVTTTENSFVLRNMIPGHTYYYKVTAGDDVLTKGAFKATGQMRMIAVEKGFNIRDLGGWTGIDGNKVRYGLIYRGASLGGTDMSGTTSDITDDDKAELYRIGIRAQLDLRAATNSGKYSGEYSYHSYSRGETTLTGADFNNTMTDYGAYNQDASVITDVAWIIYELKRGKPVYFNCRQGADRTGTVAFIIEGLLGCYGTNGNQMGMDYELTGFSQANLVDNKTVDTSYRGASEAATNTSKLFYQLLNMSASGVTLSNLQEKCYYYLNIYGNSTAGSYALTQGSNNVQTIDKADLDWFINYMLGVTDIDGNLIDGHTSKITGPSWAVSTGTVLKTVGEAKANVVDYFNN